MIIVDDDAHARKVAQQRQQTDAEASLQSAPGSSVAPADVETDYVPDSEAPPPYEASPLIQSKDAKIRTRQRFLRACSVAIFVYVLFGITVGLITQGNGSDKSHHLPGHPSTPRDPPTEPTPPTKPTPPGCVGVNEWGQNRAKTSANVTIHLDADTEILRLVSTDTSSGRIDFRDDDSDEVLVYVQATHTDNRVLSGVEVCLLDSRQESTVQIKSGTSNGRTPEFDIVVSLPVSSKRLGSRQFKLLETRLPLFDHRIGKMEAIHFEHVNLASSNSPMHAESLSGRFITLRTSNAPITGQYNASSSLVLETMNSPIRSKLSLCSEKKNTTMTLKTINGEIAVDVGLYSSSGLGGIFDIRSDTINAPSTTNIHTAPVDSMLNVHAATTLAGIQVSLPAAYEGSFEVETALNHADLEVDDHISDPAGDNRRRNIAKGASSGSHFVGVVGWTPRRPNSQQGDVKVATAFGGASLKL